MDSVVHAEDSSSASANLQLTIRKTEWASTGILKVYPEEGPSFFLRTVYLEPASLALLERALNAGLGAPDGNPALRLSEDDSSALLDAARAFLAERAALEYLARAEQGRYQLSLKLRKKGYAVKELDASLDYLESTGSLDDARYAEAWLRTHSIHQSEGRRKLLAGLLSRGIGTKTANSALDEFLSGISEKVLCKKAMDKLERMGKNGDKVTMALERKGFSRKTIEDCVKGL